jgi:hypothetical protein
MGLYIAVEDVERRRDRARRIAEQFGGRVVHRDVAETLVDSREYGVIIVDHNDGSAGALFAFSKREWEATHWRGDPRQREYVIMPRETAEQVTGYDPAKHGRG